MKLIEDDGDLGRVVSVPGEPTALTASEPSVTPGSSPTPGPRLGFLDALRGFAAMTVVAEHAIEGLWPAYGKFAEGWFKLGLFGVAVFFMISGFIIPASLERHGSIARFWRGRFFRLFPLFWTVLACCLVSHYVLGRYFLPPAYLADPFRSTVTNATMLAANRGQALAIGASWTLGYELIFYGLTTALFVAGLQRRLVGIAGVAVAGSILSGVVASRALELPKPALLVVVLAVVAIAIVAMRRFRLKVTGRVVVAGLILVVLAPLVDSKQYAVWFSLLLFALMFIGTVAYRRVSRDHVSEKHVSHDQVSEDSRSTGERSVGAWFGRVVCVVLCAGILVSALVNMKTVHEPVAGALQTRLHPFLLTFAAAMLVFFLGIAMRHRSFPRWSLWLGRVSYSIYLVHPLVLGLLNGRPDSLAGRLALLVVQLLAVVVVAGAAHRWIELPGQRMGAALERRLRRTAAPTR